MSQLLKYLNVILFCFIVSELVKKLSEVEIKKEQIAEAEKRPRKSKRIADRVTVTGSNGHTVTDTVTNRTVTDTVTNTTVKDTVTNPTVTDKVTNPTVKDTVTNSTVTDTVTNPTVKDTVTDPTVTDTVTNHTVTDTVTNPMVKDMVNNPTDTDTKDMEILAQVPAGMVLVKLDGKIMNIT